MARKWKGGEDGRVVEVVLVQVVSEVVAVGGSGGDVESVKGVMVSGMDKDDEEGRTGDVDDDKGLDSLMVFESGVDEEVGG